MASLDTYNGLITGEHRDKPRFMAVLAAIVQPMVDSQNVALSMTAKFDLDQAAGDQLDAIGLWVGLPRRVRTPIAGVYFAFDTPGVGFDQGVWFNSNEPAEGVISMDDGTYRLMIRGKIIANEWDGSLGQANAKLAEVFGLAEVTLQDNFDMTETIIVSGTPPSKLFQELVAQGYIDLKPGAVALA